VPGHQREKLLAVGRRDQMEHLVYDHVLEQVFRLLHELGIQADVPRLMIAAAPLGLHALQKVAGDFDAQLRLPSPDQRGHDVVQERLVPLVHDRVALGPAGSGTHGQREPTMSEPNRRLLILLSD